MIDKDKVLHTVGGMPDSFDLDELVEKLIFIEKIEEGIKSADKDEFISTEDLRSEIKTWRR